MYFEQIKGNENIKRAVEIALTGDHSILFVGDSGSGKTTFLNLIKTTSKQILFVPDRAYYDDILLAYGFPTRLPKLCAAATTKCFCGCKDNNRICECDGDDLAISRTRLINMNIAFDMIAEIQPASFREIASPATPEPTSIIVKRINDARQVMKKGPMAKDVSQLDEGCQALFKQVTERLELKPKQIFQILSVANTIAYMDYSKTIKPEHLAEAIQYKLFIPE